MYSFGIETYYGQFTTKKPEADEPQPKCGVVAEMGSVSLYSLVKACGNKSEHIVVLLQTFVWNCVLCL